MYSGLGVMDAETVKGLIRKYFYREPYNQAEVNYHLSMIQANNWAQSDYERWLMKEDAHLDVFILKIWKELYSGEGLIPDEPMQPVSMWKQIYRHDNHTDASFTEYLKNSPRYKAFAAKKGTARAEAEAAAAAASSMKEAGMLNIGLLKNPLVWVGLIIAGGLYYWLSVKKESLTAIPYVGPYIGSAQRAVGMKVKKRR